MVMVQGRLKGFIRTYPKAPAEPLPVNLLLFPRGKCEKRVAKAVRAVVVPLRMR